MTKEYIEREALLNALKEERKNGNFVFTSKWIKEIMDNLPTADVVEVTYCRDCQHWNNNIPYPDEFGCCQKHNLEIMRENDFCSYGERKETNND